MVGMYHLSHLIVDELARERIAGRAVRDRRLRRLPFVSRRQRTTPQAIRPPASPVERVAASGPP
jgi:hypothetical protein